ncbi:MAG TPA: GPW/gp25 family protein [Burkholderiales bacterium]|nr:GPW/gp25 family protein [Burkholderiales bacterium]
MSDFLGTGWSFPPRFDRAAGRVAMVDDLEDIEESLRILFGTRRGERLFRPDYGLDMHDILFDPLNTTLRTLLEERVKLDILQYEPRIEPLALGVSAPDAASGRLYIELAYRVRATNSRYNLVFPFYRIDSNEVAGSAGGA